jgi:hypothetical protein
MGVVELLPKDIAYIVYRYIHNDTYNQVTQQLIEATRKLKEYFDQYQCVSEHYYFDTHYLKDYTLQTGCTCGECGVYIYAVWCDIQRFNSKKAWYIDEHFDIDNSVQTSMDVSNQEHEYRVRHRELRSLQP